MRKGKRRWIDPNPCLRCPHYKPYWVSWNACTHPRKNFALVIASVGALTLLAAALAGLLSP